MFVSCFKLAPPHSADSSNRPYISGPVLQTTTVPKHLYDHTSTASVPVSNAGAGNRASEKTATSEETDIPRNPSAVDISDQYIEFKMNPGSTDRIARFKGPHPNNRHMPPTRPAPTPVYINSSVPLWIALMFLKLKSHQGLELYPVISCHRKLVLATCMTMLFGQTRRN